MDRARLTTPTFDAAPARSALRSATQSIHRCLESHGQLASPAVTRQSYIDALHANLLAYTALEEQLESHAAALARLGLDWPSHRKVQWIHADLAALGCVRTTIVPVVQIVATLADALGCMYVMEGATLGGAVIQRNARRCLQLETGTAFFSSYGDAVGSRWKQFCVALELGLSDSDLRRQAAFSAVATFTLIETCLRESET